MLWLKVTHFYPQRKEWLAKGGGEPMDHQYIVAFKDEDDLMYDTSMENVPRISSHQSYYMVNEPTAIQAPAIQAPYNSHDPLLDQHSNNTGLSKLCNDLHSDVHLVDPTLKVWMQKCTFAGMLIDSL
ncbi:hypothetical protein BDN71DRAFT_1426709 [Pleurotus eryngii]|uniref:Uncharacterized protein n=1 Tax=Pleurotus eryngii TaxID=5323 RepID=A0A9P6A8G2_PLEER|nr:hypothetical protein BDN71DRAFT_1426709 [Pleurotus eryngii]